MFIMLIQQQRFELMIERDIVQFNSSAGTTCEIPERKKQWLNVDDGSEEGVIEDLCSTSSSARAKKEVMEIV